MRIDRKNVPKDGPVLKRNKTNTWFSGRSMMSFTVRFC